MIHILSSVQIKKHNIGFYLYSLTLFIKYIHIVLKNKVPSLYLVLPLLHGAVGRIKTEDRTSYTCVLQMDSFVDSEFCV